MNETWFARAAFGAGVPPVSRALHTRAANSTFPPAGTSTRAVEELNVPATPSTSTKRPVYPLLLMVFDATVGDCVSRAVVHADESTQVINVLPRTWIDPLVFTENTCVNGAVTAASALVAPGRATPIAARSAAATARAAGLVRRRASRRRGAR